MEKFKLKQVKTLPDCKKLFRIIKLSTMCLLLCTNVVWGELSYAQLTTLKLDLKNVELEKVFDAISQQSEFIFFYNNNQVNTSEKVSIKLENADINEALNQVLPSTYEYKINDRYVLISKSDKTAPEQQQTRKTIQGAVVDDMGEPIIGANVVEKGTNNGTSTDVDGKFSLSVSNDNAILSFSFIGYITQDIPVAGRSSLSIRLVEDSQLLEEVIVVGYGTMRKSDLTGAVARVSKEELNQLSTINIGQALAGRVAGVDIISNSGEPGAGLKVRIRGNGSINNSDPLYVVDGFPLTDIDHIAPQDIESLEVMKDASATAIYGARGANGVVMIQTKKGGYDKTPAININVYGMMSQIVRKPELANAWEFATLKKESLQNAGLGMTDVQNAQYQYVIDNKLHGTDWIDEVSRTAYSQNYNISVNGGGTRSAYDMGVTYSQEQGVAKYNGVNTLIVRSNNQYKITDKIEFTSSLIYTHRDNEGSGAGSVGYYGTVWPGVLVADPLAAAWDSYTDNWGVIHNSQIGEQPQIRLYEGSKDYRTDTRNTFSGNAALQINDIGLKGLSFRTQYGILARYDGIQYYQPTYFVSSESFRLRSLLDVNKGNRKSWNWQGYFTYNKAINAHNITATLGTELSKNTVYQFRALANDIPETSNMWYLNQTSDVTSYLANNSGATTLSSMASYFMRVNYNFTDKYLLTAVMRADGSSRFIDKWGYFPSFSLGWNIHQEEFMSDYMNTFSQLKLRAGWGRVGNERSAGTNDYVALMTPDNNYRYTFNRTNAIGLVQQEYSNSALSWETAESSNVALDFGLLNMKLSGTIDFFVKTTKDMILQTPIPLYTGMRPARTNAGSMENKGIELSLKWQDKIGKDFTYAITGVGSFIKNKVVDLGSDDVLYGPNIPRLNVPFTRSEKGMSMGYFYGYKTDGIFQTQDEVDNYTYIDANGVTQKLQPNAEPGDVKFVKTADDQLAINTNDRTFLGNSRPDFTYSFNFNFGYKGFDLLIFLQGVQGVSIANAKVTDMYPSYMVGNVAKAMMNRWTGPGSTNEYPRMHNADPNQNTRFSDRYIEDGSYLRVKNIQLGYTLTGPIMQKLKIDRLRIYASIDNLHVFSNYRGFDPEIGDNSENSQSANIDMGTYPRPRTMVLGLNLNF